jgi:hypothetical protein
MPSPAGSLVLLLWAGLPLPATLLSRNNLPPHRRLGGVSLLQDLLPSLRPPPTPAEHVLAMAAAMAPGERRHARVARHSTTTSLRLTHMNNRRLRPGLLACQSDHLAFRVHSAVPTVERAPLLSGGGTMPEITFVMLVVRYLSDDILNPAHFYHLVPSFCISWIG